LNPQSFIVFLAFQEVKVFPTTPAISLAAILIPLDTVFRMPAPTSFFEPSLGMTSSIQRTAIESYIDVPFNLWVSVILIIVYWCAIRARAFLLFAVLSAGATIAIFDQTSTVGEIAKTMCLLPLGLGSVLAILVANRSFQIRYLPAFTTYINLAVCGNIGMMVAIPADGNLRGTCSKITCIALFTWIIQQGQRVGWKTVVIHNNLFLYTAVSKSWIFAHAAYRFVLLTLPCFGSGRRHRLMEFYSLTLTFALYLTRSNSKFPFEYYFGMADTLVVPTIAGWSAIATTFNLIPPDTITDDMLSNRISNNADTCLGAVSLAVASFVCFKLISTLFSNQSIRPNISPRNR
jgi:hypothetical protein